MMISDGVGAGGVGEEMGKHIRGSMDKPAETGEKKQVAVHCSGGGRNYAQEIGNRGEIRKQSG